MLLPITSITIPTRSLWAASLSRKKSHEYITICMSFCRGMCRRLMPDWVQVGKATPGHHASFIRPDAFALGTCARSGRVNEYDRRNKTRENARLFVQEVLRDASGRQSDRLPGICGMRGT